MNLALFVRWLAKLAEKRRAKRIQALAHLITRLQGEAYASAARAGKPDREETLDI